MLLAIAAVIDNPAPGDENMIAHATGLGDTVAEFPVLDLAPLDGAHRRFDTLA